MEVVVHNIRELDSNRRSAAEQLVGHALRDDQRIVIQVMDIVTEMPDQKLVDDQDQLPDWCNVYEGLSEDEIDALDQAISHRLDLTRRIDLL